MAKFEDLVNKAEARASKKGARPPYVLEVEGEVYEIPYPDAETVLALSTIEEDETLEQMKMVFRPNPVAFNALMRGLRGAPAETIDVILNDMFATWNDDSLRQPGKSKG